MRTLLRLLTIVSFAAILFMSCGKELSVESIDPNNPNNPAIPSDPNGPGGGGTGSGSIEETKSKLLGEWDFVNIHLKSTSTTVSTAEDINSKIVLVNEYTTFDNTGSMTVSPTQMSSVDLSYSATAKMITEIFINNISGGKMQTSQTISVPSSNSIADYQVITADSIFTPGGNLIELDDIELTAMASGMKVQFVDDRLILTAKISSTETMNESGENLSITIQANVVITYKRK